MMDASQKYAACADALKEYARNAGFADVVIGLSGGIDSSTFISAASIFVSDFSSA